MTINTKDLLTQLGEVVSLPSISSANTEIDTSNKPVIDYLANKFESLGFSCEIIPCSPEENGKFNLIATLGSGPGGLVLAGHTDTVPLDQALWSVDPFQVTEKDGKLFGLGITDMKGFFPIVMEAIQPLLNEDFKEPLIILATADEETSMQGARTIAELGRPKARSAIIGEPTGLKPVRTHKGIMMDSIRLLGESGHSSDPALGNNALDAMHAVISDLMLYRAELKNRYTSDLFEIPYPTLNLGSIHGGDNPNRICGHCNLEFDVRLMPGMHIETVRAEINQRVEAIVQPLGIQFELVPLFTGVPAFFAQENSPLLKAAEQLTGHSGISVAFGTEGPFLQQLGMDTIILGPGNIDQAHQPDEYMSIDMIEPCIDILRKLITQHCLY
ncbi:MAG: acetylornithine deacetylase [SAR86 cluster bacterium]|uniref:Acetylornithine deacetylase n=1 Tax=SAR86 cluster bacterium TaxID=2030880 RepID=A0A2A5B9I6_9GAMM|nr:MAG: acetylornithine deacetylase [SAR86 cluster bacterium]